MGYLMPGILGWGPGAPVRRMIPLTEWLWSRHSLLTSIGFLSAGAGMFPSPAFLSFATFLFLLRFLLLQSRRCELFLGRSDGLGPGACPQDAHSERLGLVLHGQQDQSAAHDTTQAASGKLTHRSLAPELRDMPLRQGSARFLLQKLRFELRLSLASQTHAP